MLTKINTSMHWCAIVMCDNQGENDTLGPPQLPGGTRNSSEDCDESPNHFCFRVLHDTIHNTNVRYMDMAVMIPTFFYFVFLTWCLLKQWKVIVNRPLCAVLFSFVYMVTICGLVCKAIAMTISYQEDAYKVFALLLRGSILVSELSVVSFGFFFRFHGKSKIALLITVVVIIVIGITFTVTEGILEFKKPQELPCSGYNFFTHGGMIFLFCTSVVFCIVYLSTFLVYLFRLHKKWNLPSRPSFYHYALILSLINAIQAVGSMLWYEGLNDQHIGQSGICIVTLTTIIYETTYVPMTYWIFLRNFLRSRSNSNLTDLDTGPLLATDGLLSKAKKKLFHSNSHGNFGNYGTNPIWSITDDEGDSDDESGLYSSGGSNFTIT